MSPLMNDQCSPSDPALYHRAAKAAEVYFLEVRDRVASLRVGTSADQRALHGLAWVATLTASIHQAVNRVDQLSAAEHLGSVDRLAFCIGMGEYLSQLIGGIPMSQNEIFRPGDIRAGPAADRLAADEAVGWFTTKGNSAETRAELIECLRVGEHPTDTLDDEFLDMIRDQYRRFTSERILPFAHAWHLEDALIPEDLIGRLAEMGTFGICIPEDFGGLGLGKAAMCVVTEELSRGWVAAGSLGTRSEIAGELISLCGTDEQKSRWLPGIADGSILPAAVFTEPDTGSDLARLQSRARPVPSVGWSLTGAKTWITHAARSDLMTVLARSDPDSTGYHGLSMFLVPKTRGNEAEPFPDQSLTGSEIPVLGYRGMREYQINFDAFPIEADSILGGVPGAGFKQLMQTFEGARIQTAARALGVGQRAFELGFSYALERRQFAAPIINFPRVGDKLAIMLAELLMARALTYHAATEKDSGRRCDIEAGMAKLLAARVAWANADTSLQIHGGNGYALEFEISRVLCDARILNIFEGSAEIQAQVIGKGLISDTRN